MEGSEGEEEKRERRRGGRVRGRRKAGDQQVTGSQKRGRLLRYFDGSISSYITAWQGTSQCVPGVSRAGISDQERVVLQE